MPDWCTPELIREVIRKFNRPRIICTCGNFDEGKVPEYEPDADFTRCQNCKGWMSAERLLEEDTRYEN